VRSRAGAVVTIACALILAACGGGDDEAAKTSPAPRDAAEAPSETPTPSAQSQLPPEFVECMAEQGVDIRSADDIHASPPELLQLCFGALHQNGGTP
jgi:hypothetical protein